MRSLKRIDTASVFIIVLFCLTALAWAGEAGKIDVNAATAEELTGLPGIGPVYAKRIVEYREANGPFMNSDGLLKVKGIGPKTWESIKEMVLFGKPSVSKAKATGKTKKDK